jgi:4a-hydroxytetrahydrobiopterin dehydratase
MTEPTTESLTKAKCLPCEGGVPTLDRRAAETFLDATPLWSMDADAKRIWRRVSCKHFAEAIEIVNQIAEIAESDGHHPDLHLTGYRNLRIDLTTHAIGGLSENDFIIAAKIDQVL